jgi:carbon-monoxide dehydrogenase medium subunit
VTHTEAARSPLVQAQYPALAETFRHVATPRIRNAGTVGGNLAHGDPHLDPPVTLLALDARVTARSVGGEREIALGDFFRDYYETALAPDELLTQVSVPAVPARSGLAFIKYLPRSQDDYATVDVAVWLRLAEGSNSIEESRIALGSVGPTPLRARDAERLLVGQTLSDELLGEAGELAAQACDPEDDVRGSAAYKRELVKVVVRRAAYQAQDDAIIS